MSKALTREELDLLTDQTANTIRHEVDRLPPAVWQAGLEWYPRAHALAQRWSEAYGVPFAHVAGIIAALSPRIQWEVNVRDAESVLVDGEQASVAAFGPNLVKALWILDGTDPDSELGGRKVRSFWRNIAEPWSSMDVTLDTWMAKILGIEWKSLARKGVYDAVSDAFRNVAAEHGVMPHQLQAALWIGATGKTN